MTSFGDVSPKQAEKVLRKELGNKTAAKIPKKAIRQAAEHLSKNPNELESVLSQLKLQQRTGLSKGQIAAGVLGGLFVLFVVLPGVMSGNEGSSSATGATSSAAASKPAAPIVDVTARQLANEVDKNEIAFLESYKNKRVRVTGKVDRIDADMFDNVVVWLRGKNSFNSVMLKGVSKQAAVALSKGDTITALCGSVSEAIGSAALSDCSLQ